MEGRGVPKRGLRLPTESRTEAGEGKHGLEHRLSRPRGLELQDVRTGQRTGGPTALPLSRSRRPGSLCTSLPSPRLISMLPLPARHLGQASGPCLSDPTSRKSRGEGPRSCQALPSALCMLPTHPMHRLPGSQSGRSGSPCSAPSSKAAPTPSSCGDTSPRPTSSAEGKQVQEREAWVLEFSFSFSSFAFLTSF